MAIRKLLSVVGLGLLVLSGTVLSAMAVAAESLMPFVLASTSGGSPEDVLSATKEKLKGQGFDIAGEYSPYEGAFVLVVTDAFLKKLAADETGGAYLIGQRVSVVKVGNEVQVSYANPEYLRYAYRVKKDLTPLLAKLKAALGYQEQFGAKGLSPSKLKKYHYTFGMEYFDDPMVLAESATHSEAVDRLARNLADGVGGTSQVYRIDAAGGNVTVFGVAMTEGVGSDAQILEEIDAGPLKHVAHLPYEVAVFDGEVRALHPRFRIAIDWPDLRMVGAHSFFGITKSPEAIKKVLTEVAGGVYTGNAGRGGFNVQ